MESSRTRKNSLSSFMTSERSLPSIRPLEISMIFLLRSRLASTSTVKMLKQTTNMFDSFMVMLSQRAKLRLQVLVWTRRQHHKTTRCCLVDDVVLWRQFDKTEKVGFVVPTYSTVPTVTLLLNAYWLVASSYYTVPLLSWSLSIVRKPLLVLCNTRLQ